MQLSLTYFDKIGHARRVGYNVQEFTFKAKLGFQSNNCLDLFTLDIEERKGDDGKVVQEPKSLSLVDPATAGEHARYIVTKLKPIDIKAAHAALTDKLKKRVANGALALTQCIDSHTFKLISNLPGPHPCVMLAHIMNSCQPVNVATKNELMSIHVSGACVPAVRGCCFDQLN